MGREVTDITQEIRLVYEMYEGMYEEMRLIVVTESLVCCPYRDLKRFPQLGPLRMKGIVFYPDKAYPVIAKSHDSLYFITACTK